MIRSLGNMVYKKRLKELGLFNLQKGRLRVELNWQVFKYMTDKEYGDRLASLSTEDSIKSNELLHSKKEN